MALGLAGAGALWIETPASWACFLRGGCGTPCPCDAGPRSSRDVRWGGPSLGQEVPGQEGPLRGGGLGSPLTGPVGGLGQRLPGFNAWTPSCSHPPGDLGNTGFWEEWPPTPVWQGDPVRVLLPSATVKVVPVSEPGWSGSLLPGPCMSLSGDAGFWAHLEEPHLSPGQP